MSDGFGVRRRFDIGRVFERTFGALGANGWPLLLVALIFVGLPQAALAWGQSQFTNPSSDAIAMGAIIWGIGLIAGIVCNVIMTGVVTHSVVADLQGRKAALGESLGVALRSFWVLLAVGIVAGLGIGLGMVLLIVPGVILFLLWFVAGPIAVAEKAGVGRSLARSRTLTRDHRWWLLLLTVVYLVLSLVIGMLVGLAGVALGGVQAVGQANFATLVLGPLAQAVTALIWGAVVAAAYVELRTVKEGGGQTIAAIFD